MWVGFAKVVLSWDNFVSLASGAGGVGIVALVKRWTDKKKFKAEVRGLEEDARKTRAETDDLTSVRLIRELDRLSLVNETQRKQLDKQTEEIDELRRSVLRYAEREASHAIESMQLRRRIEELEGVPDYAHVNMASPLKSLPIEISKIPNEFDEGHD